jgi:hypothetical protein
MREVDTDDGKDRASARVKEVSESQALHDDSEDQEMDMHVEDIFALVQELKEDEDEENDLLYDDLDEDGGDGDDEEYRDLAGDDDEEGAEDNWDRDGMENYVEGDGGQQQEGVDVEDQGDDYPIILSDEQLQAADAMHVALANEAPEDELLHCFHILWLSIWTSQPPEAERRRFHLPIEAYIIGSNLRVDGSIRKPGTIGPDLSKLQYLAQYGVLKDALMSDANISECVLFLVRLY